MRYTNCGKEIAPFDAKLDTRNALGGSPRMSAGGTTKAVLVWFCPDCAKSREKTKRWLLWTIVALFALVLILAMIGGLVAVLQGETKVSGTDTLQQLLGAVTGAFLLWCWHGPVVRQKSRFNQVQRSRLPYDFDDGSAPTAATFPSWPDQQLVCAYGFHLGERVERLPRLYLDAACLWPGHEALAMDTQPILSRFASDVVVRHVICPVA